MSDHAFAAVPSCVTPAPVSLLCPLPLKVRAAPRPNRGLRIYRPLCGHRGGRGWRHPVLPGAVLPPGPSLRCRRGHVQVQPSSSHPPRLLQPKTWPLNPLSPGHWQSQTAASTRGRNPTPSPFSSPCTVIPLFWYVACDLLTLTSLLLNQEEDGGRGWEQELQLQEVKCLKL
jgi:hypothetical protein